MELFKLLGTIAIDNAEAKKALNETSQEGQKTESKLGKTFSAIGKGAAVAGKAIAVGLAAGATAMAGLTAKALSASGDLEQNMGGAEAVFGELGKTIGDMKTPMQVFNAETGKVETQMQSLETVSKEAYKNMGLSQSDYLATSNKMGALFKGAGFETQEALDLSSQAMQRAADVASIMGIDTSAAMEAVAGAAKGNFTMMDNLGVAMNDTAIGAYALEKGISKSTSEMSQQEKIGLAMEMFLEKTSYAAGNYAKENETLAGSLGTAKAAFTNFLSGSGDVSSLVSSFSNLANVVVKSLTEIAPRLTQGISDLVQQVAPLIAPLLQTLLPVIVDGAVSLVNGLVAALPSVLDALLASIPALIDGVMQIVDALIGALPGVLQAILAALPTLIPQLIDGIVSAAMMLVEMLPQIIQPIIDNLPTIIISIVEALVNNLPVLIQGLIQLIMGIVTAVPQIIQALVDAIPTIVSLLVEALLTNLPAIIMGLIQVVLGIVTAIPQIFNALFVELPAALRKGIFDGLGKAFSKLGDWFGEKFKGAKEWAVNAWSDAKEKFNKVKDKCAEAFSNFKDKAKQKFSDAKEKALESWNNAKEKFNSVKDKVVDAFSNLKDKVKDKFKDAKEKAENAWSNAKEKWQSIRNKVSDGFTGLGDKLKSLFSTALNKAKEGFSKAKTIGKDLVKGLWNGINNAKDWILGKIKSFGKGILNGLKSFFGIKSPSRVMRDEVGKYLAEGVAVGITDNADKAEDAAEKLASNILSAAQDKLDTYKTYNDMTLSNEVAFWDAVRVQVKEGTKARLDADKNYLEAKKSLDDQILAAEDTLSKSLDDIYQKIADRKNAITESFALFEEFTEGNKTPKSFVEMKGALDSQIKSLEVYNEEMQKLENRLGGTSIFEEFSKLGVDSLSQLQEINNLSDYQLQVYIEKYNQREALAQKIAEYELADETIKETELAYTTFAQTLNGLGVDVTNSVGGMSASVVTNFETIEQKVGKILDTLNPKMQSFASAISSAFETAIEALEELYDEGEDHGLSIRYSVEDADDDTSTSVAINWHAKSMEHASILRKPTIFGYDNTSGKYLGGGEAGNEVVAGEQTLMNMIQSVVAEQNSGMVAVLSKILKAIIAIDGNMSANMRKALESMGFEINGREFARLVKAVN